MSENKLVRLWKGLQNPMFYGMVVNVLITLLIIAIGQFVKNDIYWDIFPYVIIVIWIIVVKLFWRIRKNNKSE